MMTKTKEDFCRELLDDESPARPWTRSGWPAASCATSSCRPGPPWTS